MNNSVRWIIIIILLVTTVVLGIIVATQSDDDGSLLSPTPTLIPDITETLPSVSPTQTVQIPDNWQTYTSDEHGFTIQYPPDVDVEQRQVGGIQFIKYGPTQTEGTEVFDAISVVIDTGILGGVSLREYVDMRQQESDNEPIVESVSTVEQVTVGEYSGYQYTIVGLGEFTYIYLPKGENSYVQITNGTVDPTDQGFAETVELMLSTLQINE